MRPFRSATRPLRLDDDAEPRRAATGPPLGSAAPAPESAMFVMGAMYVGGVSFALAVIYLAHVETANSWAIPALAVVSYIVGLVLLLGRRRLPPAAVDVSLGIGMVIITLSIHNLGAGSAEFFSILYVWSALTASFLLSGRRAAIQLLLIALCFGGYLVLTDPGQDVGLQRWCLTVATATLVGALVAVLKARVERLVNEVAETAKRDLRTGLLNASGFEDLLERELERAERSGSPLGVIILDIDHFKDVNDELGHRAADERLVIVARVLEDTKRRIDSVARVSGQEYAVLLPETDEHGTYVLADRLRRALRDHFGDDPLPLTASLGVAAFPKHGSSFEEIVGAALQALYAAKELGRDRAVIYNPEITANLRSAALREDLQSEEHLAAVLVLAETLDMRDEGTARHSETVGRYAKLIATELGLAPRNVERVHLAGLLHDIGKIGISDTILQKPDKLTDAEWDEMRKHPELGARILDGARLGDLSAWVLAHHERPDGRGYPYALSDEQIPLEAKILAVADSYEAMTADRVYKLAMSEDDAREELLRCAGSQFDRAVVTAFLSLLDRRAAAQAAA